MKLPGESPVLLSGIAASKRTAGKQTLRFVLKALSKKVSREVRVFLLTSIDFSAGRVVS